MYFTQYQRKTMKKEVITIHKSNHVIRGTDSYSLNAKKLFNAIYWGLQKHEGWRYDHLDFRQTTMRDLMNLKSNKNYGEILKKATEELMQPLELRNFIDKDGRKVEWALINLIEYAELKLVDSKRILRIVPTKKFKEMVQIQSNFTKLELIETTNKLSTDYAMKLYEYLKSFENYRYLDIKQDEINKLLRINTEGEYRYYSALGKLIKRQLNIINKKTDLKELSLIENKKEKIYRIMINPKGSKDKPTNKTDVLTALTIKRF